MGQEETATVTTSPDGRARLIGPYSKIADSAADLVFVGSVTPHLPSGSSSDRSGRSTRTARGSGGTRC